MLASPRYAAQLQGQHHWKGTVSMVAVRVIERNAKKKYKWIIAQTEPQSF